MSAAALPHPTADVGTPATALASSPVVEWVSVSPVRQMAAEPPPAGYSANMTVAAQGAPHGSPPAAKAVLEQAVRADPNDVEQQLKLRYHHLSEGRVDLATARPEGMDPRRAERLIKWMQAQEDAQQLIESGVVPRDAAERFDALAALIRQRSELQIARVELCSSIQSYGRFSAIPDDFFVAGANNRAYVYCELKNFASTEDKEGYRAHVAHRLELLTLDGRVLWEDTEFLDVVDVCRNRRTDFFFNRLWQLPAGLPAGDYILNVIIEDRLKAQRTEAKRPLTIRLPGLGGLRS